MRLFSVFVSHNRLEHLARTLITYETTVTIPYDLVVVDNKSNQKTREWLNTSGHTVLMLPGNMYPGYATNRGWMLSGQEHTLLHRSDNDITYLPGWCDHLLERLAEHPDWGQISLRTDDEELHQDAVGGNSVIRREVWDAGVRYTNDPWTVTPWEDGLFNRTLRDAGFGWGRVSKPCIVHEGGSVRGDPYYERTYRERGISHLL